VILDTDILSEILKRKDKLVYSKAKAYLRRHQRLAFSAMSVYEIVRGQRARGATKQLADFLRLIDTSDVLPITMAVLMRAAELWAEARNHGHPANDADLIIAATTLEAGRPLITGNTTHYAWIAGLTLEDWRSKPAP
jgi:tRNA(fMet)-specific endonuclease VapC